MQNIFEQLIGYIHGIWNHRWKMMLIAWLVGLIGWVGIYFMPDQYESKAKIYIDTQSLLKPLLKGLAVTVDVNQQINLMVKTLLTRANVEKIIRLSDADLNTNTDREYEDLIKALQKKISFKRMGRNKSNIYNLSYTNSDPILAQAILQAVITVFIENSIGESTAENSTVRDFINKQIESYERRLEIAEEKLKSFKQKNIGLLPSSSGDFYARMEIAKSKLEQARLELKEAQKKKNALQNEFDNYTYSAKSGKTNQESTTAISSSYDARIEELENQLSNLNLLYTSAHPDIKNTQQLLDHYEAQRLLELSNKAKRPQKSSRPATIELNPAHQELAVNLGEVKAQVEALYVRVAEYQKRYLKLSKMVYTIPEIEAQLTALNRDYKITKNKYEDFLNRRESASVTEKIDSTTEGVQFKVIESPRVENQPIGPNRILLSSLIFIIALAGGIGIAFSFSQIKPVIISIRDLTELTPLPILGSVTHIKDPLSKSKNKKYTAIYIIAFLLLIISYLILITFYWMNK